MRHILAGTSPDLLTNHAAPTSLGELDELIKTLGTDGTHEGAKRFKAARGKMLAEQTSLTSAIVQVLYAITPKFFYFDDYSSLPGSIKIRELLKADKKDLTDNETTALSLLELAGLNLNAQLSSGARIGARSGR